MRRIAAVFLLAALSGAFGSCSSDAPAPTPPTKQGGGGTPSPLLISLFTTNANPAAGNCTLIQAIVTFNGKAVDDGTGVSFSTDFGFFSANSQPVVSIVTQKGSAIASLCSTSTGTAFVNASASFSGASTKADPLKIVFQSASLPQPFFTSCAPAFGANTGGTTLVINGGNFPGSASGATATFTAAGITRQGLVTAVSPTQVTVVTPAFPEATAPSVPVTISLNLSGLTVTVPNCFAFGTASSSTPTVTALLPSSGSNDGGTRVSIIGSGFAAPLQVFIGPTEASVVSIGYNQIVVLTPRASSSTGTLNGTVAVRVHEVTSGMDSNTNIAFQYVQKVLITSWTNNLQRVDLPFTTVTIFGEGFEAPVAVSLAGFAAIVTSVSATELEVIPGPIVVSSCADVTGPIVVTNINTGDTASGGSFTYLVALTKPIITSVSPASGPTGQLVTISGGNFNNIVSVTLGGKSVPFTVVSSSQITFTNPTTGTTPICPAGTASGTQVTLGGALDVSVSSSFGCTGTAPGAFQPTIACVVPTPTP